LQSKDIKRLIQSGLTTAEIIVEGDGNHFQAIIVSDDFEDRSMVQRHQLVYKTLGEKMGGEIHALSMQTYTPAEWELKRDLSLIK